MVVADDCVGPGNEFQVGANSMVPDVDQVAIEVLAATYVLTFHNEADNNWKMRLN
jgi:hypothetical protein